MHEQIEPPATDFEPPVSRSSETAQKTPRIQRRYNAITIVKIHEKRYDATPSTEIETLGEFLKKKNIFIDQSTLDWREL